MNQYSFYIVLVFEYFNSSFSFSKRIAIILVLVVFLVIKIALVSSMLLTTIYIYIGGQHDGLCLSGNLPVIFVFSFTCISHVHLQLEQQ